MLCTEPAGEASVPRQCMPAGTSRWQRPRVLSVTRGPPHMQSLEISFQAVLAQRVANHCGTFRSSIGDDVESNRHITASCNARRLPALVGGPAAAVVTRGAGASPLEGTWSHSTAAHPGPPCSCSLRGLTRPLMPEWQHPTEHIPVIEHAHGCIPYPR